MVKMIIQTYHGKKTKNMKEIDFEKIEKALLKYGLPIKKNNVRLRSDNAKEYFTAMFNYFVPNFEWLSEYESVVEWLTDTKGKSLLMTGDVGRGKTIIARNVIPYYFEEKFSKVVSFYRATSLNTNTEEILRKFIVSIDDIGFESYKNDYGQKSIVFLELLDKLEQSGGIAILTSNLKSEQMLEMYGERAMDRIRALFKVVKFEGKSFRK